MTYALEPVTVAGLDEVIAAMSSWQQEGAPVQLHPGDLGWAWRFGGAPLAADLRLWRHDGVPVAVGALDGTAGLFRMALAPSIDTSAEFAAQLLADLDDADRLGLSQPAQSIEARFGAAFRGLLHESGWTADEPWTPLHLDLGAAVPECGVRIETLSADHADEQVVQDRVAIQRAAFAKSSFTTDQWHTMAATTAYDNGRCLVAYDAHGVAVAATTVWSAGEGRPGLIEPLGAHRDHRGHGYGRAITLAAAAALRAMGASSMTVCTPSANVGGVAAYESAGMTRLPESTDFRRPPASKMANF